MTTRRSKLTEPDLDRVALSDEETEGRLEDGLEGLREDEESEGRRLEDGCGGGAATEGGEGGPGCTSAGDEYDRFKGVHGVLEEELAPALEDGTSCGK